MNDYSYVKSIVTDTMFSYCIFTILYGLIERYPPIVYIKKLTTFRDYKSTRYQVINLEDQTSENSKIE